MEPARPSIADALATQRSRALTRVDALTRELSEMIERSNDAARDDEHDPEGSTIAFERAQITALLAAAQDQLAAIEVARRRLDAGVHHRCTGCGGRIPVERQLARPTAHTCVGCAS